MTQQGKLCGISNLTIHFSFIYLSHTFCLVICPVVQSIFTADDKSVLEIPIAVKLVLLSCYLQIHYCLSVLGRACYDDNFLFVVSVFLMSLQRCMQDRRFANNCSKKSTRRKRCRKNKICRGTNTTEILENRSILSVNS